MKYGEIMPKQLYLKIILSIKKYWTRSNNVKGVVDYKQTPIDTYHMVILKNVVCSI